MSEVAWCAACNVPVGVGACGNCRELSWRGVQRVTAPEPKPDPALFAMALSVGMGAAAEIVTRRWGARYAECIHDYIAEFDLKRLATTKPETTEAGEER